MSIGRMTESISIVTWDTTFDAEGFSTITDETVCTIRAAVEYRHGSTSWRNRAAFTESTVKFTARYRPDVLADMIVIHNGQRYTIDSVEDVAARHMWMEILAHETKPSEHGGSDGQADG